MSDSLSIEGRDWPRGHWSRSGRSPPEASVPGPGCAGRFLRRIRDRRPGSLGIAGSVAARPSGRSSGFVGPARLFGEARLAGSHDGLGTRLDADLPEDRRDVVTHRLLDQIEVRGDLRVVEPSRDVLEDLALASRELGKRGLAGLRRPDEGVDL